MAKSKITKKDIVSVFDSILEKDEDESFTNLLYELDGETHGDLTFKQIEDVGGEGEGDHCHFVYLVTRGKDKVHFKVDGWHNSHEGCNYEQPEDIVLVEPYEKKVTDWRKI